MQIEPWMKLIEEHKQRYPLMQGQDVYKLLYQGLLGPEHLLADPQRFLAGLQEELKGLTPGPAAALYEPVRPDGRLVRLHLRAWQSTGQSLDALLDACLAAARQSWGTPADLEQLWQAYAASRPELSELTQTLRQNGFPPVHHSDAYRQAYRPAYRLVLPQTA